MATKYADGYTKTAADMKAQAGHDSGTGCDVTVPFEYQLTAKLATADVLTLVPIPKGAIVTELFLAVPDMDSGDSTWQFDLGDADSATTYYSNCTLGRSAGKLLILSGFNLTGTSVEANTALPKRYSSADNIILTVDAEGNTAATTGTVKGYVRYTLQHSASALSSNVYGGVF